MCPSPRTRPGAGWLTLLAMPAVTLPERPHGPPLIYNYYLLLLSKTTEFVVRCIADTRARHGRSCDSARRPGPGESDRRRSPDVRPDGPEGDQPRADGGRPSRPPERHRARPCLLRVRSRRRIEPRPPPRRDAPWCVACRPEQPRPAAGSLASLRRAGAGHARGRGRSARPSGRWPGSWPATGLERRPAAPPRQIVCANAGGGAAQATAGRPVAPPCAVRCTHAADARSTAHYQHVWVMLALSASGAVPPPV
jgi:hypothetical protein